MNDDFGSKVMLYLLFTKERPPLSPLGFLQLIRAERNEIVMPKGMFKLQRIAFCVNFLK